MAEIHDKIIALLTDNGIDFRDNDSKLAKGIKALIEEYSNPYEAITLLKPEVLSRENMVIGKDCPLCGQYIKLYRRAIESQCLKYLIELHKKSMVNWTYYHAEKDLLIPISANGGFCKLRYWGLTEEQPNDTDEAKRTSGMWKITQKGIDFVLGKARVPRYINIYNGTLYGVECESVDIHYCIGKAFSYAELMNGAR